MLSNVHSKKMFGGHGTGAGGLSGRIGAGCSRGTRGRIRAAADAAAQLPWACPPLSPPPSLQPGAGRVPCSPPIEPPSLQPILFGTAQRRVVVHGTPEAGAAGLAVGPAGARATGGLRRRACPRAVSERRSELGRRRRRVAVTERAAACASARGGGGRAGPGRLHRRRVPRPGHGGTVARAGAGARAAQHRCDSDRSPGGGT
jgi:hypothetical protein